MTRIALIRGGIVVGAAAVVLVLERRRQARRYREPWVRHTSRNLVVAGIAAATVSILETPFTMPAAALTVDRGWGLTQQLDGPPWIRAIVAIVLLDYTLYIWHIATHRVQALWRFHLVHHVDLDLDASTALRFHAGELALSVPWRLAQVMVIGVSPVTLAVWQSLTLASILFHHSNTALPSALERAVGWIVVTPRMHAIHHSVDLAQRDRNFSSGLACWDRLHRTLRIDAAASEVEIGVPGYLHPPGVTLPKILALPVTAPAGQPQRHRPDRAL
jgi:sterol desaturase/sphingolipid hydroxylase (fatty acid hydroxylase superfamily)